VEAGPGKGAEARVRERGEERRSSRGRRSSCRSDQGTCGRMDARVAIHLTVDGGVPNPNRMGGMVMCEGGQDSSVQPLSADSLLTPD